MGVPNNPLTQWTADPRAHRGLCFLQDGSWRFFGYDWIASRSFGAAAQIADAGASVGGEVVCLLLPTGPSLVASIFGTWLSGNTVCPLVPPVVFEDEESYVEHVGRILSVATPRVILTDGKFSTLVQRTVHSIGLETSIAQIQLEPSHSFSVAKPAELALLQFTSGSSGTPRGVRVTLDNLNSNIDSIKRWIGMLENDITATWLPLFHDMGLIGCLLTPTVNQSDVYVMRPEQFIRDPNKWIDCFGKIGATLCASPNFGYGYLARKISDEDLVGCDFSNWRVAIAGAEPVDAAALTQFAERLAPYGFDRRAFLPAYGLAEATLAVTGGQPRQVAKSVRLDWESLGFGRKVKIEAVGDLSMQHAKSPGWLVSSGRPHSGSTVQIVNSEGLELPSETLGEILVRGPSVSSGYRGNDSGGPTRFSSRGLLTGDAGFFYDGELFVVGRIADSIKVRGRAVYAEDLEARLAIETGIKRGRCVVVMLPSDTGGSVLVLGEGVDGGWVSQAGELVKSIVGEAVPVRVIAGRPGAILRTSSGKPRRRAIWQLQSEGGLDAIVATDF